MAKRFNDRVLRNVLYFLIFVVVMLVVVYISSSYLICFRPHVKSIHVINLDKDSQRWDAFHKPAHLQIERFPAIYGKNLSSVEIVGHGVGMAMIRSGQVASYSEQNKDRRNLGVVGCYLSHKLLIEKLGALNVPDHYGHLILEDDAQIPDNFLKVEDEWHKVYKNVPMDWDIVYLDITNPIGKKIGPNVMKLEYKLGVGGNWGTHAYMVKHSSIRKKISPWLKYMVDSIDEHYKLKFNEWNVYAIVPGIIKLNEEQSANSTIQKNA